MSLFYSMCVFFFKQKTAYEMRISDWSSACALPIFVKRAEPQPGQAAADTAALAKARADLTAKAADHDAAKAELAQRHMIARGLGILQIGRASCRERVCQYV